MQTLSYWDSFNAIYTGPTPPSPPTVHWWDNSNSTKLVLNRWMSRPYNKYVPEMEFDVGTCTFSDLTGSSAWDTVMSPTAPAETGGLWIQTSLQAPYPVMSFTNGTWTQVGTWDPTRPPGQQFGAYAPALNDAYTVTSLASVTNPQESDRAWVTSTIPYQEHLFLGGAWRPTGDKFYPSRGEFVAEAGGVQSTPTVPTDFEGSVIWVGTPPVEYHWNGMGYERASSLVPVGGLLSFAGLNAPAGWLLADGSSFSAATYPLLANALNSSTLPDYRGRFILGAGNGYSLNATGGAATHTLIEAELAPHTHTMFGTLNDADGTNRGYLSPFGFGPYETASAGGGQPHNNMPPYRVASVIIKHD